MSSTNWSCVNFTSLPYNELTFHALSNILQQEDLNCNWVLQMREISVTLSSKNLCEFQSHDRPMC
eukprot:3560159-Amphidinium_carterae.1